MSVNKKRIAFSGLICCDALFTVEGYPQEDAGIPCDNFRWNLGGNASNNSVVFSKLRNWHLKKCKNGNSKDEEIEIELLGTLGNDFPANFLREIFDRENIRHDRMFFDPSVKTPVTAVILNALNGSRSYFHYTDHYPDLSLEKYVKYDLVNYDWIHVESRNNIKGIIDMVRYVRSKQTAGSSKPVISVELETDHEGLSQVFDEKIDYYFVERDFGHLKGWKDLDETIQETCKLVKNEAYVIFVWGDEGSRIAKVSNGKIIGPVGSTPIFNPKSKVVDTCGAGDTFLAATVFDILIRGSKPEDAIVFGSKIAGAKVAMQGYHDLENWESYINH
ncbi:ketohexokinase-like [Tetranychus urticae]|uniref:Carbohydrate kinase PfkB domain-containing protein n=1 Tax=Tetranychus urticae TaxID=32264 RepID=T1K0P1_TETUR|nr:ketohexokinase-like [Tetranychus urticae]